jgi:ubiquinone/menaquinone biosynthesis C-methylase UbiE
MADTLAGGRQQSAWHLLSTRYIPGAMDAGALWSASFGGLAGAGTRVYDELMVPRMFSPWARLLVKRLRIAYGESVLDVACGPGSVARVVAERVGPGGKVIGCDLSPAMLAAAAGKPAVPDGAAIEYLEARAERLPVPDRAVDVVTCQQGLQFFPERPAALAEMRRVLRAGGRVGIAVWAEIGGSPPFASLADGLGEVVGRELADRYRGGPFGFPDGEVLRSLVADAGFEDVSVTSHELPVTFEAGAGQVVATLSVTPLAGEIDRLDPERKRALVAAVARRTGGGPIASRMRSDIAIARR